MDDVTIVDDMAMLAVRLGPPAPQGEDGRRALETFEPIVIKMHPQPMADQSRGDQTRDAFRKVKALEVVTSTLTSS